MKKRILLSPALFPSALLILQFAVFSLSRSAQTSPVHSSVIEPQPVNLDFEQGETGKLPTGWVSPTKVDYSCEVTEENPKSGKRAALLRSVASDAAGAGFGNIMQAIDAKPFRGRRVRLRAAVRIDASMPAALAQLWMRVDRDGNKPGFFDNMGNRPIASGDWNYYEIVGDIDDNAAVLNIGMILIGKGRAWLDDASVDDLGKLIALGEPARTLTERGLENVVAFTRLFGYVRHFHPSDQAAATDWNTFAVAGVRSVEDAANPADLAKRLNDLFLPIAPTLRVYVTGKRVPDPVKVASNGSDPSLKIVQWRHIGFGQTPARAGSPYSSERVRLEPPTGKAPTSFPDSGQTIIADLGGGVSCLVPMALYADAKGTLPHVEPSSADPRASLIKYSGNDRETRLGDVVIIWNILQHFYPYFDVVETDWQLALREALASAANDNGERAFLDTLRRMIVQLQDG